MLSGIVFIKIAVVNIKDFCCIIIINKIFYFNRVLVILHVTVLTFYFCIDLSHIGIVFIEGVLKMLIL